MGTYIRPDKTIRENIPTKMEEDRDAVQAAFAQATQIEHSVDFIAVDAPPVGGDTRIRMAGGDLTPHFGSACCMPGSGAGAVVDITLGTTGGPSILTAPAPIGIAPGVPVVFSFKPGTVIPVGTPICYTMLDNGGPVMFATCHVEYIKDVVPLPVP